MPTAHLSLLLLPQTRSLLGSVFRTSLAPHSAAAAAPAAAPSTPSARGARPAGDGDFDGADEDIDDGLDPAALASIAAASGTVNTTVRKRGPGRNKVGSLDPVTELRLSDSPE